MARRSAPDDKDFVAAVMYVSWRKRVAPIRHRATVDNIGWRTAAAATTAASTGYG